MQRHWEHQIPEMSFVQSTFQFLADRQESILSKYDECVVCLLLFVCQLIQYLCEIYASVLPYAEALEQNRTIW